MIKSSKEINKQFYKHYTPTVVRYMDIDALRHVNNARYLNYLEEARLSYSQEVFQLFNKLEELNVVVARIEIDFLRPILYGQQIGIWTRVSKIKRSSFIFDSVIGIEKENSFKPTAQAFQTLVYFDPATQRSTHISENIISKIKKFEIGPID